MAPSDVAEIEAYRESEQACLLVEAAAWCLSAGEPLELALGLMVAAGLHATKGMDRGWDFLAEPGRLAA
jgi:hypothetical protein